MKTIEIKNGSDILTKTDSEGLVERNKMGTMHETAEYDHTTTVLGWPGFDGERDWYRLPGAAWTFCYRN